MRPQKWQAFVSWLLSQRLLQYTDGTAITELRADQLYTNAYWED